VKLLILGGTKFLGRATTEAALARGHEVTLFNRGETNPDLFPEAEKLRGDRTEDLSALTGRTWDAVVDPSGYVPRVVRASAEALAESVELYLFISSISVYADRSHPLGEDDELEVLQEGQPDDRLADDYSNYGALKALCEQEVRDVFGDRASIVRPGLIVGAHDPTGRFTYWPHRVARGGDVIVPAPPEGMVQFIDVRDLASWVVELCETRTAGTFNATSERIPWQTLVEACRDVSGSDAHFTWIDGDFLAERDVGEWMDLPLWIHDPEGVGILMAEISRAKDAGLTFRPLAETIRETLDEAETTDNAGLAPDREAELLAAWAAR
jgi:2'-hydroxyisoflavone reductase